MKSLLHILFLFILPLTAYANALEISPIKVHLSDTHPVETLQLTNKSQETIYLQLESNQWKQQSDKDIYTVTRNVIALPSIITIPPGGRQLVRVALRAANPSADEDTYRLYINEIPHYDKDHQGVRFHVKLGIPVFVAPRTTTAKNLEWDMKVQDKSVTVTAHNISHYHFLIYHIDLKNLKTSHPLASRNIFEYILPGQTRRLSFPVNGTTKGTLIMEAKSDQGTLKYQTPSS